MRRFFSFIAIALAIVVSSCSKFDDTDIWNKLNDHEKRIVSLEELCKQMNTNISSLQSIVNALQKNDYITNVSPVRKDGEEIGYTITFAYGDTITIYHGTNGKDGANGKDGKDGYTPQIGVMKDTDGIYYWTVDGEWLLDGKGNKIQANGVNGTDGTNGSNGQDGTNGTNGKDGADGVTPRLKIENDYWYVSYDNGATWTELGKATGEDGNDGANGSDGADGEDGDSIFKSVTQDDEYVYFNLADGTMITLPKTDINPNIIQFEDRYVKDICVSNWDTDGDGELSYDEAAAVTSIGLKFANNPCILYFDEFRFFTGVQWSIKSGSSFYGCINLSRITLPKSIIKLGQNDSSKYGCFEGCTNLKKIVIPASVDIIHQRTFKDCTSLTTVVFEERSNFEGFGTCNSSANGVFCGCVALETLDMSGCSKITSFAGYNQMTDVDNLKVLKIGTVLPPTIGDSFFSGSEVFNTATLYVPYDGLIDYAKHSYWGKFLIIREI